MRRARLIIAAGALAVIGTGAGIAATSPAAGASTTRPAIVAHHPPAVCRPLVRTIEYWLPILDRATPRAIPTSPYSWVPPHYPWTVAATAIIAYIPRSPEPLATWEAQAADSIVALGVANSYFPPATWQPILRQALRGIKAVCPTLPKSIVNGPMPGTP